MKCEVCGNLLNEKDKECAVCGTKTDYKDENGEEVKEKWFTNQNQILLVGAISLYLLFYMFLQSLISYGNFSGAFNNSAKAFGIVGLIFGIPMLLGIIALIVFQVMYLFKHSIKSFDKISHRLPFIGFLIHAGIAFFSFILMIWAAALFQSADTFFNNFFMIYGLQAIHIWLFMIAVKPKEIFPKKPAQPSDVVLKDEHDHNDYESEYNEEG